MPEFVELEMSAIVVSRTAIEAGYINHDDDLGGETNHGITKSTSLEHRALWGRYGWDGDMKTMPRDLAYDIYYAGWVERMHLDDMMALRVSGISYVVERLFDFGINAGRVNAGKALQRWLNVLNRNGQDYPDIVVDGFIGPATVRTVEAFCNVRGNTAHKLISVLHSYQLSHYLTISEARKQNQSFTNGWLNRVWHDIESYWDAKLR